MIDKRPAARCYHAGRRFQPDLEVTITNMTAPMTVDDATFAAEVLNADKPILVDFWAPWCGPCRLVSPVVEAVGEAHAEKITTAKVNTDENQQLALRYGIFSIPTLIVFKDGREAARLVGYMPQAAMEDRLREFLA
jgi:thioredoxin 1